MHYLYKCIREQYIVYLLPLIKIDDNNILPYNHVIWYDKMPEVCRSNYIIMLNFQCLLTNNINLPLSKSCYKAYHLPGFYLHSYQNGTETLSNNFWLISVFQKIFLVKSLSPVIGFHFLSPLFLLALLFLYIKIYLRMK